LSCCNAVFSFAGEKVKYLYYHKPGIERAVKGKKIFLFLDYDGTLAPLAATPKKAGIPEGTMSLLEKIAENYRFKLAFISGRKLKDIENKTPLKNALHSGNHGLEIEGRGFNLQGVISRKTKTAIRRIAREFAKRTSPLKGVLIEDKGVTVSLHYRLADKKDMPQVNDIFKKTVQPYVRRGLVKINPAKMVYEVRPPVDWDKGKAIQWIFERYKASSGSKNIVPVFIGDDSPDEPAFVAVRKEGGITVRVGNAPVSRAEYYVRSIKEVPEFLEMLLKSP